MSGRARTLLALAWALLVAALATRRGDVAALLFPVLTLLAAGLLRAPAPGRPRLCATRRIALSAPPREPGGTGVGATAVRVEVEVRNEGTAPVHLRLLDAPWPPLPAVEGALACAAVLPAGGTVTLRYGFRAARGRWAWRGVRAWVSDPLELAPAVLDLGAAGEARVVPAFDRLRALAPRPRRTVAIPGAIPARRGGAGTELWGVRPFQPGDPLRRIAWRHGARHPGELFTKELEQEQVADVGLVLDARPEADARAGDERLREHAVRAVGALADVLLRGGNRVSLAVLGDAAPPVFPGVGRVQRQRILACLAGVGAQAERYLLTARGHEGALARLFPARGLVVIVTAAPDDLDALLGRLAAFERQLVLVSPDAVDLAAPRASADPVEALAVRAARLERRLGLRRLAQLGVRVVDWEVHRPLGPLVARALAPARGVGAW